MKQSVEMYRYAIAMPLRRSRECGWKVSVSPLLSSSFFGAASRCSPVAFRCNFVPPLCVILLFLRVLFAKSIAFYLITYALLTLRSSFQT